MLKRCLWKLHTLHEHLISSVYYPCFTYQVVLILTVEFSYINPLHCFYKNKDYSIQRSTNMLNVQQALEPDPRSSENSFPYLHSCTMKTQEQRVKCEKIRGLQMPQEQRGGRDCFILGKLGQASCKKQSFEPGSNEGVELFRKTNKGNRDRMGSGCRARNSESLMGSHTIFWRAGTEPRTRTVECG